MTVTENSKPLSLVERMKLKAQQQTHYGGEVRMEAANVDIVDCRQCGAGRADQHGLTHCRYCGFEFMKAALTDGIHITRDRNSQ